jgi:hypothetical protein
MQTKRWPGIVLSAALIAAPLGAARAQSNLEAFDWPHAPALGAGLYQLGNGTTERVYRAPLSVRVRKTPDRDGPKGGPGVSLLLPITAGIEDRGVDPIPLDRLSGPLEQAAIAPGVALEWPAGKLWTLRTSANLGYGEERRGSPRTARIGIAEVRSRVRWADAPGRPALINALLWTGFDGNDGTRGSLLRFENALEFDIPVARWQFRGQSMRFLPHVLNDRYSTPPPALALGPDGDLRPVESEWQVGLAAGREGGFKILFFRFDSVGVAYRFSGHSDGLRVYLNGVF